MLPKLARLAVCLLSALCLGQASALAAAEFIVVQSTTSTQNSGLYDYLLPIFESKSGIAVRVVAVGTGQAFKNAQNCDADALLVHDKSSEERFVAEGHGIERQDVMYNDFVLVGPSSDPAGVAGGQDVTAAFSKIRGAEAPFASRGDNSGTHTRETKFWLLAGIDITRETGSWYRETGSGMGATLNIAVEGDSKLFNQYGVVLVNPERCPNVKVGPARRFVDWIVSEEGQAAIAAYQRDGKQLFYPNAGMR